MEYRQLEYFVAVAEELHFGHAAERTHLTQAALSQQVRRLERELGVRLLDRTTRRVRLTGPGRLFLNEARVALARAERAAETARNASNGQVGQLLVGYPLTGRGKVASAMLRTFRERYPGVVVTSVPSRTADLPKELRREAIDVAYIHHSIQGDRQLTSRTISRTAYMLAIQPGHRLENEREVAIEELAGEALLFFSRQLNPHHYDQLLRELSDSTSTRPEIVEEASAIEDLIDAVEAGIGLALIIESEATRITSANIVVRPFRAPAPTRPLGIAWRRNDQSPVLDVFLGVVDELLGTGPGPP
jgi:DNA-binding transcriptional LysR family regulator